MEKICLDKLTLEPMELGDGSWVEDDTQHSSAMSSVVVTNSSDQDTNSGPVVHTKRVY